MRNEKREQSRKARELELNAVKNPFSACGQRALRRAIVFDHESFASSMMDSTSHSGIASAGTTATATKAASSAPHRSISHGSEYTASLSPTELGSPNREEGRGGGGGGGGGGGINYRRSLSLPVSSLTSLSIGGGSTAGTGTVPTTATTVMAAGSGFAEAMRTSNPLGRVGPALSPTHHEKKRDLKRGLVVREDSTSKRYVNPPARREHDREGQGIRRASALPGELRRIEVSPMLQQRGRALSLPSTVLKKLRLHRQDKLDESGSKGKGKSEGRGGGGGGGGGGGRGEWVGSSAEPKITGGHWPFSVHFSKMADQNIKQDTFKCTNGQSNPYYRHDKMVDQHRNLLKYFFCSAGGAGVGSSGPASPSEDVFPSSPLIIQHEEVAAPATTSHGQHGWVWPVLTSTHLYIILSNVH